MIQLRCTFSESLTCKQFTPTPKQFTCTRMELPVQMNKISLCVHSIRIFTKFLEIPTMNHYDTLTEQLEAGVFYYCNKVYSHASCMTFQGCYITYKIAVLCCNLICDKYSYS